MLQSMESNERYVVVRRCYANQIQYLGRVSSLKEFDEYRNCCGFDKADIGVQDWNPDKVGDGACSHPAPASSVPRG